MSSNDPNLQPNAVAQITGQQLQNQLQNQMQSSGLANQAAQGSLFGAGIGVYDPGHSHSILTYPYGGQGVQAPITQQPRPDSWSVNIERTENGFLVDLLDRQSSRTRRYIAASLDEVLENIAAGFATAALEK
ncbi:hypothetical protein [Paraburkholderia sp. BL10I2N1]|uniref:hypothetical protein n=1 Tax=Paraburkholderia sp. BL10I2N1 TaxID=1938796 RepID=UPI001061FD91|nr:hypothetical protein [Paraburkholderia sp. BL10I2N1]